MAEDTIKLVVKRRQEQGHGIMVLDLVDAAGGALPAFSAGAHVDIHLSPELVRQYSLCSDPTQRDIYRLGILKDAQSRGGSVAAHATLKEGDEVFVSLPRNHFPLVGGARRSILIGGGIGITPMIAMAHALSAEGADFELHYRGRSREACAFVDELAASAFSDRVHTHFGEEGAASLDLGRILGAPDSGTHVYVCGPAGFMSWVIDNAKALGFADEAIHREFFQVETDSSGAAFEVEARRTGATVRVEEGQSIVDALAKVGIKVKVSCEQGVCGTCLCDVIEGTPDHRDVYLTDEEKMDNDQILLCCSRARTARLVLDI